MRALALAALLPLSALADPAEIAARIDSLYAKRDDAQAAKELEAAIAEGLKAHPEDYRLLWRAARGKWWVADGAQDIRLKRQLAKDGWALGEKAQKANPKAVEGYYFTAISVGAYAQAVGILKALAEGLEGKFLSNLDKSLEMDPGFSDGGPWITKGRYYSELPWPKRDLDKSRQLLEKAMQQQPQALRLYLYLAETQLKAGEAKKATQTISKALSGDPSYDPPEARRVKELAKTVAAQIEEELK